MVDERTPAPALSFEWLGDPSIVDRKEWVLSGVFGRAEVVLTHANPKSGKTQFATDLSFHVATGKDWFGRKLTQGAVLYLATEKGRVTKKRFRALQRMNGDVRPPIAISTASVNLLKEADVNGVIQTAVAMSECGSPLRLIVIDTLNRAMPGVDENAAGTMGAGFNNITRIAEETGAAVLVLHHNTQGKDKMRGSSAIAASADVVISLVKNGDECSAEITMANDAVEGQTFDFSMDVVEVWPASADREAETTIVIRPLHIGAPEGAPAKTTGTASKAVVSRAEDVFEILQASAKNGVVDRQELLSEARTRQVVNPNNPKSSAEGLRQALVYLESVGRIGFDQEQVWISVQTCAPNTPMLS